MHPVGWRESQKGEAAGEEGEGAKTAGETEGVGEKEEGSAEGTLREIMRTLEEGHMRMDGESTTGNAIKAIGELLEKRPGARVVVKGQA